MTVLPSHNPNPFEPTLLSTIYLNHWSNLHNLLVLFSIFLLQSTNPDPTSELRPILPPKSPPNHKFNWLNLLFLMSIIVLSSYIRPILQPTRQQVPQSKPLPYRTSSSLCPHFTLHCILLILLLPTSPLNHKLKYSIFCFWFRRFCTWILCCYPSTYPRPTSDPLSIQNAPPPYLNSSRLLSLRES